MSCLKKILDAELGIEILFLFKHLSPEEKGDVELTSLDGHPEGRFKDFLDERLSVREVSSHGYGSAFEWQFIKEVHLHD